MQVADNINQNHNNIAPYWLPGRGQRTDRCNQTLLLIELRLPRLILMRCCAAGNQWSPPWWWLRIFKASGQSAGPWRSNLTSDDTKAYHRGLPSGLPAETLWHFLKISFLEIKLFKVEGVTSCVQLKTERHLQLKHARWRNVVKEPGVHLKAVDTICSYSK